MNLVIRIVHGLSTACGVFAAACLIAACLVVCQMVILRYVLGESTVWQTEFVTFSVVASTLIGSPYVLLTKGHVNVDLLPHYLGHRARMVLCIFASALGLAFCAILAWVGWDYFHEAWTEGWVTDTVWALPLWIPLIALPVGLGLLTAQYLIDIYCILTGRDMPFGMDPDKPTPPHPEELE